MTQGSAIPAGAAPVPGVTHHRSPNSVGDTARHLTSAIEAVGAKVFAVIDQAAEAKNVGLQLRPTELVVFGSPLAGTPLMLAAPLAALDLPLKILVWEDDRGSVWLTHLDAGWLAARYGLSDELAKPLGVAHALASRVSAG